MKTITKFIYPIICVLLLSACEDDAFFEKERLLATQLTDPVSSTSKLDEIVNGTYWMMIGPSESGTGNPYDNMRTWNMLGSDVFGLTDPPRQEYLNGDGRVQLYDRTNNHQLSSGLERTWRMVYSNISNVNLVIAAYEDALPGVPFNDEEVDQLPRIVGEAYFLRGYHLWIAHQIYGPTYEPNGNNSALSIILKDRNSRGLEDVNVAQSTVEEVYQALIADFDSAATNLPDNITVGRVSKPAAEAMLARIYLEMGDFNQAEQYATNVIQNYGFALENQPIEAFNKAGTDESSEVIWEYQWTIGHQFARVGFITPIPSSQVQWVERRSFGFGGAADTQLRTFPMSKSILQKIGWMDANFNETNTARNDLRYQQVYHRAERNDDSRIEGFTGSPLNSANVWVFKDCRKEVDTNNGTDFSDDLYNPNVHYPLIRLSEMHLTRAIARARQSNDGGALEDVNTVRQRAWDTSAGPYSPLTIGNLAGANSVEEAIEIERIKELTGEGDRLYYLKAMKMDIPPGDRATGALPYNDASIIWQLPPSETDLNESAGS